MSSSLRVAYSVVIHFVEMMFPERNLQTQRCLYTTYLVDLFSHQNSVADYLTSSMY